MPQLSAHETPPNQRERLWQIDFLARFRGQVTRQDLVSRFAIAPSNATRDFSLYRQLAPDNLDYDHSEKVYRRAQRFQPLFSYDREHTLQALTLGQGVGLEACQQTILVDTAPTLSQPDLDILATVSRAIYARKPLTVSYVSINSGESTRQIVPHSWVNTGLRWHTRAYCRTHNAFRDFVLTRITSAEDTKSAIDAAVESVEHDEQWNRNVVLELIPHPRAIHSRPIELDYGLTPGQSIKLSVRAATAGYQLRHWGVDCSEQAELSPQVYQLALRDPLTIAAQANLSIAPGFSKEIES